MTNFEITKIYAWPAIAQIIVICLFGLFILYLGYYLDLSPLETERVSNESQERNLIDQYKTMVKDYMKSISAVRQVPYLQSTLNSWQTKFATAGDISILQDTILNMGENAQLKISNFNPGAEMKAGAYTFVPIKIEAVGTYDQIATYISQIANVGKAIKIRYIEINSINPGGLGQTQPINSNNPVDVLLTIEIYKH